MRTGKNSGKPEVFYFVTVMPKVMHLCVYSQLRSAGLYFFVEFLWGAHKRHTSWRSVLKSIRISCNQRL